MFAHKKSTLELRMMPTSSQVAAEFSWSGHPTHFVPPLELFSRLNRQIAFPHLGWLGQQNYANTVDHFFEALHDQYIILIIADIKAHQYW